MFWTINRARTLAEGKVIRHVRTPAGADTFGQPIGSVIVADAVPSIHTERFTADWTPSARRKAGKVFDVMPRKKGDPPPPQPKKTPGAKHLWDWPSDLDGYDMVIDSRNVKFYVIQDEYGWSAWDSNDTFVAEGKSRATLLKTLDEMVMPDLKDGMRWGNDDDRKRLVIPPAWRDVSVSEDENTPLQAIGYDAKGRGQYRYTGEHRKNADAEKFARMERFGPKLKVLDKALAANRGDNTSDCLMIIRALGMRPDSGGSVSDVETFGATSLQARHVKVTDAGLVTLTFTPGKKKEPVTIKVKDKALADMLRERLKTRSRNDPLFDDVNAMDLAKLLKSIVGNEFKVKDLRTIRANAIALAMVMKRKGEPKTKAEFRKWRKEVAQAVSDILGNTPTIALSSYINPAIFQKWMSDPSWM